MKRKILAMLTILLFINGCSAIYRPQTERLDIQVERLPAQNQKITDVWCYQEEGDLAVSGHVTSSQPFYLPGHVDIVLCSPDGSTLGQAQAPVSDHSSKRGGVKTARFQTEMPQNPPAGSKIRLNYHTPPFAERDGLDCL